MLHAQAQQTQAEQTYEKLILVGCLPALLLLILSAAAADDDDDL
jgi:hypothetical protein